MAVLAAAGLCAGAVACAAVAAAQAREPMATVFTFQGRGWGHGVGMSQYGARGQALAGRDAGAILRHYYRGTTLTTAPTRTVKVLLSSGSAASPCRAPPVARHRGDDRRAPRGAARGARHPPGAGRSRWAAGAAARRAAPGRLPGPVRLASKTRGGAVAWGRGAPRADQRYRGQIQAVPAGTDSTSSTRWASRTT